MERRLVKCGMRVVSFLAVLAGGAALAQEVRPDTAGSPPSPTPGSNAVILSEPEGGVFHEGGCLSWTVLVEGTAGTPKFQWNKDSSPIPDKTDKSFAIESLTLDDSGWYDCKVTDGNGVSITTEAVYVDVKALNAIPAARFPALMAAAALCVMLGARRRQHRV